MERNDEEGDDKRPDEATAARTGGAEGGGGGNGARRRRGSISTGKRIRADWTRQIGEQVTKPLHALICVIIIQTVSDGTAHIRPTTSLFADPFRRVGARDSGGTLFGRR